VLPAQAEQLHAELSHHLGQARGGASAWVSRAAQRHRSVHGRHHDHRHAQVGNGVLQGSDGRVVKGCRRCGPRTGRRSLLSNSSSTGTRIYGAAQQPLRLMLHPIPLRAALTAAVGMERFPSRNAGGLRCSSRAPPGQLFKAGPTRMPARLWNAYAFIDFGMIGPSRTRFALCLSFDLDHGSPVGRAADRARHR